MFYEEQSISKEGTSSVLTHLEINRVAELSSMEFLIQTSSEKPPKVEKVGKKKNYKQRNNKILTGGKTTISLLC